MLTIGLMSGTSADGIDAALVELDGAPPELHWRVMRHTHTPYPTDLRDEIFACFRPETGTVDRLCALNFALGRTFANAALHCIHEANVDSSQVDLIGSHGQTLWHIPIGANASTLQLGEPAVIAELTGITTVSNFRTRDMAAGGQGAPLVAYVDQLLFSHPTLTRTTLNIGGIANFTYLPADSRLLPRSPFRSPERGAGSGTTPDSPMSLMGSRESGVAFDTGPGNMLIDDAVRRLTNGQLEFDRGGEIATRGRVNDELFEELMDHPYLAQRPPKTTGREVFGAHMGEHIWQRASALGLRGEDVVATLTMLTAASIVQAHRAFLPHLPDEVIVSGGGARNETLMRFLREQLQPARVLLSDAVGVTVEAKEALAFAVLAYETWHNRPGNLPSATGAKRSVVLGSVTPGGRGTPEVEMPNDPSEATAPFVAATPLTESQNPATTHIDALSTEEMVKVINTEDQRVAHAVATQEHAIAQAIDAIAQRMREGGRLIYVGAGTSGRLGVLDASEMPPTYNTPPGLVIGLIAGGPSALTRSIEGAEDNAEQGKRDLAELNVTSRDCMMGIAASGGTPYVIGALEEARARGALTISLACNADTPIHRAADIAIAPLVGPEVVTGSTRMKAGSATKMVLNTISTGVMIKLGKTFGNLMVDVQPTNNKLRERAVRIVAQACGISMDNAATLLAQCGGEVKMAIVAHLAQVMPDQARARLAQAGGVVRRAISGETGIRTLGALFRRTTA